MCDIQAGMQAKWRWTRLQREIVLVFFYSIKRIHRQSVIPNEAASHRRALVSTGRGAVRVRRVRRMLWLPHHSPARQHHPAAAPRAPRLPGTGSGMDRHGAHDRDRDGLASECWAGLGGAAANTSNFSVSCRVGETVLDIWKANGFRGSRLGTSFIGLCTSSKTDTRF